MPQRPYGLLCPITHACEVIGARWTIQILAELWNGSTRYNDIRRGVGNISSALLSKRLKEMEAAGLVDRLEDRASGTVDYIRTEKAIRLEPALNALAEWAQCNIDAVIALRNTDTSTMMWALRRWKVDLTQLPNERVVIRFHFNDKPAPDYPTYWLVAQPGNTLPELCTNDPHVDVDLFVETSAISLGAILAGRTSVSREIEKGDLFLTGDARIAHTMHRWLRRSDYADFKGIAEL